MEQINGHIINSLPIDSLTKVSDLLEYEGPILSHFRDSKNNNYLFYWIDFNNNFNRWIIWKITTKQLYDYLKGTASLKELLEEANKDYIFTVDIDEKLEYHNIQILEIIDLPQIYLPEEESYYILEAPKVYNSLINEFEGDYYVTKLREKSLIFKLSPNDPKFSKTVSIVDAGNFMKKLADSILGFVEESFYKNFKEHIEDYASLKRVVEKFKKILAPRGVDFAYGSFIISIGLDTTKRIGDGDFNNWQDELLENYKKQVVNIDYNSQDELNVILENYNEEARRKIYGPYIDIINDKNYKLEATNYRKTFKKIYVSVPKPKELILLPKPEFQEPEIEKKKLLSVIIEVSEGQEVSKIGKRDLQSGLLFSKEMSKATIEIDSFRIQNYFFKLYKPLEIQFYIEDTNYFAEHEDLGIVVIGLSKEDALEKFKEQLAEKYFSLKNGLIDEEDTLLREKLDAIIESVEDQYFKDKDL